MHLSELIGKDITIDGMRGKFIRPYAKNVVILYDGKRNWQVNVSPDSNIEFHEELEKRCSRCRKVKPADEFRSGRSTCSVCLDDMKRIYEANKIMDKLKKYLKQNDMRQRDFAKLLQPPVAGSTVSTWLKGKYSPSKKHIKEINRIIGGN